MLDVRALANFILDRADELNVPVTNMALNKIAYFVHCDVLIESGDPLVNAKIEAWKHGPVFREVYHEFKRWDDRPIRGRATKISPITGEVEVASVTFGSAEGERIKAIINRYIHFSASHLRALSHVGDGPWDRVWKHSGRANPGMQIGNDLIRNAYQTQVRQ